MIRVTSPALLIVLALSQYGYDALAALLNTSASRIFYVSQGVLGGLFFWLCMTLSTHPLTSIIAVGGVVEQTLVVSCAAAKLHVPKPWVRDGESMCDSVLGFPTYPLGMLAMTLQALLLTHRRQRP